LGRSAFFVYRPFFEGHYWYWYYVLLWLSGFSAASHGSNCDAEPGLVWNEVDIVAAIWRLLC